MYVLIMLNVVIFLVCFWLKSMEKITKKELFGLLSITFTTIGSIIYFCYIA